MITDTANLETSPSAIVLPASRLLGAVVFFSFLSLTGLVLLASMPDSASEIAFGIVFFVFGTFATAWALWGHSVISFSGPSIRVEASLWSHTISFREFECSRIENLRIDTSLYSPWSNRLESPNGLPWRFGVWNPPVRFDYEGTTYALGDGLDEADGRELLGVLQSAALRVLGNPATQGRSDFKFEVQHFL